MGSFVLLSATERYAASPGSRNRDRGELDLEIAYLDML